MSHDFSKPIPEGFIREYSKNATEGKRIKQVLKDNFRAYYTHCLNKRKNHKKPRR